MRPNSSSTIKEVAITLEISIAVKQTVSDFMYITTLVNSEWQTELVWFRSKDTQHEKRYHTQFTFHHLCNCSSFLPFIVLFVYSAKKLKSAFIPGNATLVWMVLSFTSWIA